MDDVDEIEDVDDVDEIEDVDDVDDAEDVDDGDDVDDVDDVEDVDDAEDIEDGEEEEESGEITDDESYNSSKLRHQDPVDHLEALLDAANNENIPVLRNATQALDEAAQTLHRMRSETSIRERKYVNQ